MNMCGYEFRQNTGREFPVALLNSVSNPKTISLSLFIATSTVHTDMSESIIRTLEQTKISVVFPVHSCTWKYPDESRAAGVDAI